MGNIFDNMQRTMFNVTTTTFGYGAVWGEFTANVHYRKPTEKDMIEHNVEFSPATFFMEYKELEFPGLFESVRSGNNETIVIDGKLHALRSVFLKYDGKTLQAHLEILE